jgi:hypothetical protein
MSNGRAESSSCSRDSPVSRGVGTHAPSDSGRGLMSSLGRACRFGWRDDRSVGDGEHAEERSSDGQPIVFGKNGGYCTGDAPPGGLLERLREWRGDAGKARACREMHEPDAVTAASARCLLRSDLRVPFPVESELPPPAESEKKFPKKGHPSAGCLRSRVTRVRWAQPTPCS